MESSVDHKIVLAKEEPLAMDQLTTSHLQLLASAHGNRFAWRPDRAAVLSLLSDVMLSDGSKVWLVENVKVGYKPGDSKPHQARAEAAYCWCSQHVSQFRRAFFPNEYNEHGAR